MQSEGCRVLRHKALSLHHLENNPQQQQLEKFTGLSESHCSSDKREESKGRQFMGSVSGRD